MIEQLLNFAWLALAIGSFAMLLRHRRDGKAIFALAFALALLFPIISASDDMMNVDRALEEVLAVLASFAIAFILTVVARLSAETHILPALILAPEAGTRGPPRG
ncbi:MAG TPA: hypothetical protein VGJ81_16205 [Thermoanaerobaculia bacterium]